MINVNISRNYILYMFC